MLSEKIHFKQRNAGLDLIRGLAILIVIIGHSIQANLVIGQSSFIWQNIILVFQMPLLFFISGFTSGFSYPSNNPLIFIGKKIKRLLVPYLMWAVIHYCIVSYINIGYRQFGIASFFKELVISDFWFLRFLFVFFLIMWVCDLWISYLRKSKEKLWASIILLISFLFVYILSRIPYINESVSGWYYIWFVLGYIVSQFTNVYKSKFDKLITKSTSIVVSGVIIVVMIIVLSKIPVPSQISAMIFVPTIYIFAVSMERYFPRKMGEWVGALGENTLPLYSIHWCILFSPLWRLGIYTELFETWPLWVSALVTSIMWILVSFLIIGVLKKYKWSRVFLLGGAQ